MRFRALAADFDGTLAKDGVVAPSTLDALQRVKGSGRRLLLVTGRAFDELLEVFPEVSLFDRVVAENGLILFRPAGHEVLSLAGPPSEQLVEALRSKGVPVAVGRDIVATVRPHETSVLEAIQELGLELEIVFNKEAVMVLPTGHNKATGLQRAVEELDLDPASVVGVGDAENDHAFLELCGFSAAVANSVQALKDHADHVTQGERGAGVEQLIEALLADDLASVAGAPGP
ncbi:MAG TPA: HAD family hydrolase [Actinomycetota bacterium]|nr:HAD family hydrolase [Actinomycetota bacterium]